MRLVSIVGLLFAATTAFAQVPATPGATAETPAACHQAFSKRVENVMTWKGYVAINARLPKDKRDEGAMVLLKKGTIQNLFYTTRMTLACNRHDFEAYRATYRALRAEQTPTATVATMRDWERRASIVDGRFVKWLFAAGDDCITRGYDLTEFKTLLISGVEGTSKPPDGHPMINRIADWFQLPGDTGDEMEEPEIPHCGRQ